MTTAPRILVVGYNAWDVSVVLGGAPPRDTKLEVPPIRMGGGGPAATAAVALARLGARVTLLTPLTDDAAGAMQAAELRDAGVDIAPCPRVQGARSAMAVILVDPRDGARTILWSRGEVPHLPAPERPDALLDAADMLYVDGHEPAASLALAAAARRRGLPVVMDAGGVREGSHDLVGACTDVVSSRDFAPALTGRTDPVAALRGLRELGPRRVALTAGAHGVLALTDAGPRGVPAFAIRAVDTTGAGDAFHAGYAYARARGEVFLSALRWGAAVAALKCRDLGGRRALPDRAEVEELLAVGAERPLGGVVAKAVSA